MKKQMKLYLSLILSVSFVAVGLLCYKNVNASTDAEDNIYTYAEYNATYKETKAIPTDNVGTDTVFAGWYLDANFTEPVKASTTLDSEAEGNVYAKFVDKELLTLRLQLDADLASNLTAEYTSYMRLLTSVDSLNYQKVEFIVNGTPYTITEVYSSVQGYKDGSNNSYTPQQTFGSEDAYRFAVMTLDKIQNLPATDATDHLGASLTVTPRWTTLDGTVVTGEEKTFEINDFLYEAEINDTLTGATDGTAHRWGTVNGLEDYVSETDGVGGTGEAEAIVVTVLRDAAFKQLGLYKNMQVVNAPGKTITLSRSTDSTVQNWIDVKTADISFTLGSNDGDGALIVDGTITAEDGKADNRIVDVKTDATFILGRNVTLQNVTTTAHGGAVRNNGGVAYLYGNIVNCVTTGRGGAVYQEAVSTSSSNTIVARSQTTIDGGTFTGNKATYGGVIAMAALGASGTNGLNKAPGNITIQSGTFKNNEATYGGVASVYNNTTYKLTINGGTFQNNKATQAGGAFHVDATEGVYSSSGNGNIYRSTLVISDATVTGNTAPAESTTAVAGGGAIFMIGQVRVELTNVTINGNTAYGKAGCDIAYNGVADVEVTNSSEVTRTVSQAGQIYIDDYTSFDGIIGVGAFPETSALALRVDGTTISAVSGGEKYLTNVEEKTITPVVAEYYTATGGNYYDTVNNALAAAQKDSNSGTGDTEAIKISVLKDAATTQLVITKNIQLENAPGKTVTLSRATTNKSQNWIDVKTADTTFTLGSDDETGALIVDGTITAEEGKADNRIVDVKADATFVLEKNATLQNVVTTQGGGAIRNQGTAYVYGNIKNCQTTGSGGAIYQSAVSKGANSLTISGGTFEDNKAVSGGVIATQPLQASSTNGLSKYPGNIIIESGTFKNNTATNGGVASVYNNTTMKFTITGGTFQNNTATKAGGVFYVDATEGVYTSSGTGSIYRSVLVISDATITGNKAAAESTTGVAGGGAIFINGKVRVELDNVTVSDNTADGYAGYEIAYNGVANVVVTDSEGVESTKSQDGQIYLTNCDSFTGIIGWCGAEAEGATMKVSFLKTAEGDITQSMAYGKAYTVDYSGETPTLTEITAQ